MSWTRRINHPSECVSVDDEVDVVVLDIDKDKLEISLGMKQTEVNPWELVAEKYPPGTIIEGKVRNLARAMVDGVATFRAWNHQVLDPHITESTTGHHPVISAPGTKGIELGFIHSVFEEVASGGGVFLDRTGGRNMVGGDRVAKNAERTGIHDVDDVARGSGEAIEEGRVLDIGGVFVPRISSTRLAGDLAPLGIGGVEIAVELVEYLGLEGGLQLLPDFGM
ncbi:MAG: hypothetical protein VYA27_09795 [Verrucomicrobiota bacterium]|nr:hypothetical protein [Verrucomicrobiota bacterium]